MGSSLQAELNDSLCSIYAVFHARLVGSLSTVALTPSAQVLQQRYPPAFEVEA